MEKIVFWCSILFQPNLANLQPVTALIRTAGEALIQWTKENIHC